MLNKMDKEELINAIKYCQHQVEYYSELSKCEMLSMCNDRHYYASCAGDWNLKLVNFIKQLEKHGK